MTGRFRAVCLLACVAAACRIAPCGEEEGWRETYRDLVAAMRDGGATGPNRLPDALPREKLIALESGPYRVTLDPRTAFTMSEIRYKDALLGTSIGAHGTVILTAQGKRALRDKDFEGDPWIGTGHGGEIVLGLACTVDGEPRPVDGDAPIRGDRIVVEKTGILYRFESRAVLTITPEGIEERRELTALEAFDDLHYLYVFMHPWVPTTAAYRARYGNGDEEEGLFGDDSRSIRLSRRYAVDGDEDEEAAPATYPPRVFVLHDPHLGLDIVQTVLEPLPAHALIQVRDRYHKYYTVVPVRNRSFAPGETLRYALRVEVVEPPTETAAAGCAGQH